MRPPRAAIRRLGFTIPKWPNASPQSRRRISRGKVPSKHGGRSSVRLIPLPPFPTTTIGSFPQTARGAQGARRTSQGRTRRCGLQRVSEEGDRERRAHPGGTRHRRAGAWRVRAQRHGRVFRRAAGRLCLHAERLGAVLRLALREAADHLRRCVAAQADDGRVVGLRAVAHQAADEGHAHRAGDHPAMVVRARRPAPVGDLQADRARHPRRSARSREGRHPPDPDRRAGAARRLAAAQCGARRRT